MKKSLILAGALALLTSACGRMADLESPVRETERAPRSSRAPGLPEPATMNRPSSSVPIDGGPSNPIGAILSVLTPWIPEPVRLPLLLGGALAASITRATKLKAGLRSVAKSIDKARQRDPEFESRFAGNTDLIRSIQTPTAMKVIDRAQR